MNFFLAALYNMWNLSSPNRAESLFLALKVWSLNHWTAREVAGCVFLSFMNLCVDDGYTGDDLCS